MVSLCCSVLLLKHEYAESEEKEEIVYEVKSCSKDGSIQALSGACSLQLAAGTTRRQMHLESSQEEFQS